MKRAFAILMGSVITPGAIFSLGQSAPTASQSQTAPSARQSPNAQQSAPQQNQNQNRPSSRRDQDMRDQQPGQNTGTSPDNRNSRRTNNQRDDNMMNRKNDLHFVALIAAQHQLQLNVGQIGEEKATNESVRQFARRMVEEHSALLNQLASIPSNSDDNNNNPTDPNVNSTPPFEAPGRPGHPPQLRQPDGSRPNPSDRPTSTPRQNQQQRNQQPQQSMAPAGLPSSALVAYEPIPLTLVAFQRQNQEKAQDKRAPAGGTPLVTPGVSPDRSPTDQGDRNSRQDSRRARDNRSDGSSNSSDTRFSSNNPVVQALQQVVARRFSLAQNELANLSGDAFDRGFMQLEVALHIDLIASQSALASISTSRQFQQILEEGLSMDEEHLGEARRILAQLQGTSDTTTDNTGTNTGDRTGLNNTGTLPSSPNLRRPQSRTSGQPSTNDQAPSSTRSPRP